MSERRHIPLGGDVELTSYIEATEGGLRVATVTLDDDAIKALPSTSYEIVAPTEPALDYNAASTIPLVHRAFGLLKPVAFYEPGSFDAEDQNKLLIVIGGGSGGDFAVANLGEHDCRTSFTGGSAPEPNLFDFQLTNELTGVRPELGDNGLYLLLDNRDAASALTGGNAANRLQVTVWYAAVALVL